MAVFTDNDGVINGTSYDLIGTSDDDILTITGAWLRSGATSGIIDLLGETTEDIVRLTSSNLANVTISGVERTELTGNGANEVDATQIINLGTITNAGNTSGTTIASNIRISNGNGQTADFSGLSLQDNERINVSTIGLGTGDSLTVDLSGGSFADTSFALFSGSAADETVIGGTGNDSLSGGSGDDSLEGGEGNDTLIGSTGIDTLVGGNGDDLLIDGSGGSANSEILGGAGNDRIEVSSTFQNGTIDGGADIDTLELSVSRLEGTTISGIEFTELLNNSANRVDAAQIANLGTITNAGNTSGSAVASNITITNGNGQTADLSGLSLQGIERISVTTSGLAAGDSLTVDLSGATFADTSFAIFTGSSANETVTGSTSNDSIVGSNGDDSISGGDGNDTLDGGSGIDTLQGGDGDDLLIDSNGGSLGSVVQGGAGNDFIDLSNAFQNGTIDGGADTDTLELNNSNLEGTTISGIEFTELFNNGGIRVDAAQVANLGTITNAGNTANSTTASNLILTNGAGQVVNLSGLSLQGPERLLLSTTGLTSTTGIEIDLSGASFAGTSFVDYNGTTGQDTVFGGSGNDDFVGGNDDDLLSGGGGNDTLNGGNGVDTLIGGAGDDLIIDGNNAGGVGQISAESGNDEIQIANTFSGASIDGGADTDSLRLQSANLTGTTISGIEATQLFNNGSNTIDSAQIANLGILTNGGNTSGSSTSSNVRLTNFSGQTADFSGLSLQGDERLTVSATGQTSLDIITVDFSAGTFNDNSFVFYNGNTGQDVVTGGTGNDSLVGGNEDDVLAGGAGNDTINGGSGSDTLLGGTGEDRIIDSGSGGSINAGSGNDRIELANASSNITVDGGADTDTLRLQSSNANGSTFANIENTEIFNTGQVAIDAAQVANLGAIILTGNVDNTTNAASFSITNGAGQTADFSGLSLDSTERMTVRSDNLATGEQITVDFSLASFAGSSFISYVGGLGDETVLGGSGDDSITGSSGDDELIGNGGNDTLSGNAGTDTLFGGAGDDLLIEASGGSEGGLLSGGSGNDRIEVFSTQQGLSIDGGADTDTLELSSADIRNSTISGIEFTEIASTGTITMDAEDIGDLGSVTGLLTGISFSFGSVNGQIIDLSGVELTWTQFLRVGFTGIAVDDAFTTDFSGVTFSTGSTIDYNGGFNADEFVIAGATVGNYDGRTGLDTISFAGVSGGLTIDLDGRTVTGGNLTGTVITSFENVIGTSDDDVITGVQSTSASTRDNEADGGDGNDVYVVDGDSADFTITTVGAQTTIVDNNASDGNDGTDILTNFEILRFNDQDISISAVPTPTISIVADTVAQAEGDSGNTDFTFTVRRIGDTSATSSVSFSVGPDTSSDLLVAEASDFAGGVFASGTVNFAAGEEEQTVTVSVVGDVDLETDESFTVTISNAVDAVIATGSATATIQNDDVSGTESSALSKFQVNGFTVGLAYNPTTDELFISSTTGTIQVYSPDGTFVRDIPAPVVSSWGDIDYVEPGFTLNGVNVPAGSLLYVHGSGNPVTLTAINPTDGSVIASLDTVGVQSQGALGATYDASSNTIFLLNWQNDDLIEIDPANGAVLNTIDLDQFGFDDNYGDLEIDPSTGDLLIASTSENTILRLSRPDFDLVDEIPIPAGVDNPSGIAILDNDEVFLLGLNGEVSRVGLFSGPPLLEIGSASGSVSEGSGGGTTTFSYTINRLGDTSGTASVDFVVTPNGLTVSPEANDFANGVFPSGTVNFADGDSSQTVTFDIVADDLLEENESFTFEILNPTNALVTSVANVVVSTIRNDDATTTPSSIISTFNPDEGGNFIVALAYDPVADEVFTYAASDAVINVFASDGTFLRDIATPVSASWGDLEIVDSAFTLGSVSVNAGDLLFFSGTSNPSLEVFAIDPATGISSGSFEISGVPVNQAIGAAWDGANGRLVVLNDTTNALDFVDPQTGLVGSSLSLTDYGFSTSYGDVDIDRDTGDILVVSSNNNNVLRLDATSFELLDFVPLPAGVTQLSGLSSISATEVFASDLNGDVTRLLLGVPNSDPTASDDSFTTDEDTGLTGNIITVDNGNGVDVDPEGDLLSVADARINGFEIQIGTLTNIGGGATILLEANGDFTYTPNGANQFLDDGESRDIEFTYTVIDGNGGSDGGEVTFSIDGLNDAPVFVTPNTTLLQENTTFVRDTAASDVDGDAVTYAIAGGADAARFDIDDSTGELSFSTAPDFENPADADGDNIYEVTISASDGDAITTQDHTVTIANQIEQSTLSINNVAASEGDAGTTQFTFTISLDQLAERDVTFDVTIANGDTDADDFGAGTVIGTAQSLMIPTGSASATFTVDVQGDTEFETSETFTVAVSNVSGAFSGDTLGTGTIINDDATPNTPPTAVDDTYTATEDTTLTVAAADGVLENDADLDADPLEVALVTDVTNGTLSLNIDGSFTYTPDANFNGTDSFTYNADDGQGGLTPATVTITVDPVNDDPVAVDDGFNVTEDGTLNVVAAAGVLGNDSDVDGDTLTAALLTDVSNGTLTLNGDGSFDYTPDANFNGTDSFTYEVNDGQGGVSQATVNIDVTAVNDDPFGNDDSYSTAFNTAITISAPGVLANDTDIEGDALSAMIFTDPSDGTVTVNADGSFTYTPDAGFTGADSFVYSVDDGNGGTDTATVTVNVGANGDPNALADSYTLDEDNTATINAAAGVLANDTDPDGDGLTATLVTDVSDGMLTLNRDGSFSYTPDSNFNGTDSFTYEADDGNGGTQQTTVTLNVTPVNDDPVANNDTAFVDEDDALGILIAALANDTDVDGDALSVTGIDLPTLGALIDNQDGTFTFIGDPNANGTEVISYTIGDGNDGSATADITITVNPVNDVPVANNDRYATAFNSPLMVATLAGVLVNDTDVENDALTAIVQDQPDNGAVTLNPDGSFTYTPDDGFTGTDSFTYLANDGTGNSNVATVSIAVGANGMPTANADSFTLDEDAPITVAGLGVLLNDTDPENDTLSATVVSDVSNGTLTLNADGSFDYAPDADFNGTDSFTYEADDGNSGTSQATVTLTINPVNDAPQTQDDAFSLDEDTTLVVSADGVLGNDSDVDGNALAAMLLTDVANGTLSLSADGSFSYTPDLNFFGTDSFTYEADDGQGGVTPATVMLTVNPINDAPVLDAANQPIEVAENTTAVETFTATDIDGDSFVFDITGGEDAALFEIDTDTGALSFVDAPDFEDPIAPVDNIYEVQIGVSDGELRDDLLVEVQVTDVDEGPSINIIQGDNNAGLEVLTGTGGVDYIFSGGGFYDLVTGGSDADVFIFEGGAGDGQQNMVITDFEAGIDALDLGGQEVFFDFSSAGTTYLYLDGGDFDLITVQGASSIGDITFVEDTSLIIV